MEKNIREFIQGTDLDAIFLERRDKEPSTQDELKAFAINPSIILWKFLYRLIGRSMSLAKNLVLRREINSKGDDERIAEDLAAELDVPIHRIDKSIEKMILDQGPVWSIWSWLIFLTSIYQLFNYSITVSSSMSVLSYLSGFIILLGTMFGTVSLFLAMPFIYSDIHARNIYMMDNLVEINRKNSNDEVLLVTGRKHTEGFKSLCNIADLPVKIEKYKRTSLKRCIGGFIDRL